MGDLHKKIFLLENAKIKSGHNKFSKFEKRKKLGIEGSFSKLPQQTQDFSTKKRGVSLTGTGRFEGWDGNKTYKTKDYIFRSHREPYHRTWTNNWTGQVNDKKMIKQMTMSNI